MFILMSVFPRTRLPGHGEFSFFSARPALPASINQAADDFLQKRGVLSVRPQHRHHRAEYEGYELLTGESLRKCAGPHTGIPVSYTHLQTGDRAFRWMWLAIVLSFAFYIPVVLWADVVPLVGRCV